MEGTPRLKKRLSLTFGRHHKRDASPNIRQGQTRPKTIASDVDDYSYSKTPKSPSVSLLSSDVGIECTPPNKKFNLDDSVDFSTKCFDTSFSPSLLSQTFSSNSPEVGWKWGRRSVDEQIETAEATPESTFAADSGFTSATSSNTEVINAIGRIHSESHTHRFVDEMRREEHRRKREVKMRREEKLRADELLKQRCVKLEEQLREADKRRRQDIEQKAKNPIQPQNQETTHEPKILTAQSETVADLAAAEDIFTNAEDMDDLDDFFNDSDSDGLLLVATQQVESKIIELSQNSTTKVPDSEKASNTSSVKANNVESESSKLAKDKSDIKPQEKRSSLYLKFLEDDSPDDWFLSLDDVILQATQQTKKPRNSFQRHNSMPANTLGALNNGGTVLVQTTTTMATTTIGTTSSGLKSTMSTSTSVSSAKIKRHASSHALSPSSCTAYNYRDRRPQNKM